MLQFNVGYLVFVFCFARYLIHHSIRMEPLNVMRNTNMPTIRSERWTFSINTRIDDSFTVSFIIYFSWRNSANCTREKKSGFSLMIQHGFTLIFPTVWCHSDFSIDNCWWKFVQFDIAKNKFEFYCQNIQYYLNFEYFKFDQ